MYKKNSWGPYDQYNNDKIEEAYQKYADSMAKADSEIEITVNRKYKFTINMKDKYSLNHGPSRERLEIRRRAKYS